MYKKTFVSRVYEFLTSKEEVLVKRIVRIFYYIMYYCFARHLPGNAKPYSFGARQIRGYIAKHLLKKCGNNPFVEHGASFSDGSHLEIGDDCSIGINCQVARARLGNNVIMGPDVVFIANNHDFSNPGTSMKYRGYMPAPVITVGDNTWIGTRVIILPGRQIGKDCIIGAGAVVTRNVPDNAIAAGNPAKIIRFRK